MQKRMDGVKAGRGDFHRWANLEPVVLNVAKDRGAERLRGDHCVVGGEPQVSGRLTGQPDFPWQKACDHSSDTKYFS